MKYILNLHTKITKELEILKIQEKLFYNALTLPLHKDLTIEDQEKICKIIKNTLSE